MPLTSIEQLVSKSTTKPIEVPIRALGESVYIRAISGAERDGYEASVNDGVRTNLANYRARLCVLALSDAEGKRICKDSDAPKLGRDMEAQAICEIFDAARKHNGLTEEDVQELAGNSPTEPSGDSGSS